MKNIKNFFKNFSIFNDINLYFFRRKWRKLNTNNYTTVINKFDEKLVNIGNYTYGELNVRSFGKADGNLKIGSFCSIGPNVTFLLSGEHNYKLISTYPFKKKFLNIDETISKGDINVKDDVWIGYGAIILSGVTIGQGAVIGAGSIVSKDIPPYAIYCGNKVIKYRFDHALIEKLLKIDFSNLKKEEIMKNMKYLYCNYDINNVDEIISKIQT